MALLDRWLYRAPFEGSSARRYARDERPAFGDLDDRLLDALAPHLRGARRLLDVGCGPATFALRAHQRFPDLVVLALDPSRAFTAAVGRVALLRAAAEALPIAGDAIDVAICLSSIRHVRDRRAALRELRRVVRPGGRAWIVELDPTASRARIAAHADHLGSALLRHAFAPLVLRTAPTGESIAELATAAGFTRHALRADPVQPVYILELG